MFSPFCLQNFYGKTNHALLSANSSLRLYMTTYSRSCNRIQSNGFDWSKRDQAGQERKEWSLETTGGKKKKKGLKDRKYSGKRSKVVLLYLQSQHLRFEVFAFTKGTYYFFLLFVLNKKGNHYPTKTRLQRFHYYGKE